MRFVKPKADPSKTLAISLIGACLMLLVDLFVLDGKRVIWPPKPRKEISKEEIARIKDQHSKYLDQGILAPAAASPHDQFIKQVNLEPQKSGGSDAIAALPYEEFYYNTPSLALDEIAPAAGEPATEIETQQETHPPDPYFKTELQPFVDEDIRESAPPDMVQPEPEKQAKTPEPEEITSKQKTVPLKLAAAPQAKELSTLPAAVPPQKTKTSIKSGTVVIIIDDMGLSAHSREVENLPGPLTLAYLPYAEGLPARTAYAKRRGHELMVHMPMQPQNENIDGGPTLLRGDQGEDKFRSLLRYNLARFDGFVGVNNHMGSKLTTNRKAMKIVMEELRRRGLYFIDSKTIGSSIAAQVASEAGLKFAERDIFLDHEISLSFVRSALKKVEITARQKGYAIAIGHPHEVTIQALREWLPTLNTKGLTLRPASAVVHYGSSAVQVAHSVQDQATEANSTDPAEEKPESGLQADNLQPQPPSSEILSSPGPESRSGFMIKEDGSIIIP